MDMIRQQIGEVKSFSFSTFKKIESTKCIESEAIRWLPFRFRLIPNEDFAESKSDLYHFIVKAGGTVVSHDLPYSIRILNEKYFMQRSDVNIVIPNDTYSSLFIYRFIRNLNYNLDHPESRKYLISPSDYAPYDAIKILRREVSWSELSRLSNPSKKTCTVRDWLTHTKQLREQKMPKSLETRQQQIQFANSCKHSTTSSSFNLDTARTPSKLQSQIPDPSDSNDDDDKYTTCPEGTNARVELTSSVDADIGNAVNPSENVGKNTLQIIESESVVVPTSTPVKQLSSNTAKLSSTASPSVARVKSCRSTLSLSRRRTLRIKSPEHHNLTRSKHPSSSVKINKTPIVELKRFDTTLLKNGRYCSQSQADEPSKPANICTNTSTGLPILVENTEMNMELELTPDIFHDTLTHIPPQDQQIPVTDSISTCKPKSKTSSNDFRQNNNVEESTESQKSSSSKGSEISNISNNPKVACLRPIPRRTKVYQHQQCNENPITFVPSTPVTIRNSPPKTPRAHNSQKSNTRKRKAESEKNDNSSSSEENVDTAMLNSKKLTLRSADSDKHDLNEIESNASNSIASGRTVSNASTTEKHLKLVPLVRAGPPQRKSPTKKKRGDTIPTRSTRANPEGGEWVDCGPQLSQSEDDLSLLVDDNYSDEEEESDKPITKERNNKPTGTGQSTSKGNGVRTGPGWRQQYTRPEGQKLLDLVCKYQAFIYTYGLKFWRQVEESKIFGTRTHQSLKNHFIKTILPNVLKGKIYTISEKDLKQLKKELKEMRSSRHTNCCPYFKMVP